MRLLKKIILSIISIPVFSRIWGFISRCNRPKFIARYMVKWFQRHYKIPMEEYIGEVKDYNCLSDFFVRPLDPEKRPLVYKKNTLVSPADGILSGYEKVSGDEATQVKGEFYKISDLLQESLDFSQPWYVLTIYLSPFNYHRFHYPIPGKVDSFFQSGGLLYPVNKLGLSTIKSLFPRNQRIVTKMTANSSPFYIVAVGATNVGSIGMEYFEGKEKSKNCWVPIDKKAAGLEELGRFRLGSTMVLVFPSSIGEPLEINLNQPLKVGEPLFKIIPKTGDS